MIELKNNVELVAAGGQNGGQPLGPLFNPRYVVAAQGKRNLVTPLAQRTKHDTIYCGRERLLHLFCLSGFPRTMQ